MYQSLSANLNGKVRRQKLHGRDHVVAPITMIVPGVLNGSSGPLYYSQKEIGKNPEAWNGMPIVVDHPADVGGNAVSARDPDVLEQQAIGVVLRAHNGLGGKLKAEGWFDVARTLKVEPGILQRLQRGEPIEVSTGLHLEVIQKRGTYNGKKFVGLAKRFRPDHLAVLPNHAGACSLRDGCGVLNQEDDEFTPAQLELLANMVKRYSDADDDSDFAESDFRMSDADRADGLAIPSMNWETGEVDYNEPAPQRAKACGCHSLGTRNSGDEGLPATPSMDWESLAHPGLLKELAGRVR